MKTDFDRYYKDRESLIKKGWESKYFAFQIGGGEDEDDTSILVKGDKVLWWEYSPDRWHIGSYSKCNYTNGVDTSGGIVNIKDYIS